MAIGLRDVATSYISREILQEVEHDWSEFEWVRSAP